MVKAGKKKAPSRVKYDRDHPTVSCRVPREIYDRLQAVKDAEGRSFADILKAGLGLFEVRARKEAEVRKQAYVEGYKAGYAEAENLYKVSYRCCICGETLAVTSGDEKASVGTYMREHGWGHQTCHEGRRR